MLYRLLLLSTILLAGFVVSACERGQADHCVERADDYDCDGVPDAADFCPGTAQDVLTDRVGCSENQSAGCDVQALAPDDGARVTGPAAFRWLGDCEVYLLQFSDDPDFPPGATRTAARTTGQEHAVTADEMWWRVVGGNHGKSTGAHTEGRELRWR
jgi:hypothetical protein